MSDPLSIEALAARIYSGFILPASKIDPRQWREQWKLINRAAGVIAGISVVYAESAQTLDAPAWASSLVDEVIGPMPASKLRGTFAKGLAERVAKCLLALSADAPEVTS